MSSPPSPRSLRATYGLGVSLLLIFGATLFPFRFRLDRPHLLEKIGEIEWELYYTDRPGHVTIDRDVLQNLVLFAPLGVSLAFAAVAPHPKKDTFRALGIGALLSVIVELLQLLTETRVTQLADVWRNALGAAIGAFVVSTLRARRASTARP